MSKLEEFHDEILHELLCKENAPKVQKDILIVVHDQLNYVKVCFDSVFANTKDYTLYVWDNASQDETKDYLKDLERQGLIVLTRSETNEGFIIPNNRLFSQGKSSHVILLNSDTRVHEGWSEVLTGYLHEHWEVGIVGYQGGKLNPQGEGRQTAYGKDVDYVSGWCLCTVRELIEDNLEGVLFDEENLIFAYAEDSDLSLRMREADFKVYALHVYFVDHFENKTILTVHNELGEFVQNTFDKNHEYIRRRWGRLLPN